MPKKDRDYAVRIGAAGWEHPAWSDTFYPEDLPSEWRLAYYANAFPVVLMPARRLVAAGDGEIADWRELADTGFRVLLEVVPHEIDSGLLERVKALGDTAGGWVLGEGDGTGLEAALAELAASGLPVALEDGTLAVSRAEEDSPGRVWRGEGPSTGLEQGRLAVIRIPAGEATPRRLRDWLETGLAVQDGRREVVLILEGAPPPVETLEQAQLLLELL